MHNVDIDNEYTMNTELLKSTMKRVVFRTMIGKSVLGAKPPVHRAI